MILSSVQLYDFVICPTVSELAYSFVPIPGHTLGLHSDPS